MYAKKYSADNLPAPSRTTHVLNPDGILGTETVDSVNLMLLQLERSKGVQGLVVVVGEIDGDDPYRLSIDVGRKWGVGQKNSMGFVMVLATIDRSYHIQTGIGLEKFLPDAICKRIQNQIEVPLLKEERWEDAIKQTVKAYKQYLEKDPELVNKLHQKDAAEAEYEKFLMLMMLLIFMGLPLLFVAYSKYKEWQKSRCSQCGKHTLKEDKKSGRLISDTPQHLIYEVTYRCNNCGHREIRRRRITKRNNNDDDSGPIFIPFGSGRGFGNSGFGGGGGFSGLGGGSFGGGGSGGRF